MVEAAKKKYEEDLKVYNAVIITIDYHTLQFMYFTSYMKFFNLVDN